MRTTHPFLKSLYRPSPYQSATFNLTAKITGQPFAHSIASPPKHASIPRDRAPDWAIQDQTLPEQALIYRLSGDYNPLHVGASLLLWCKQEFLSKMNRPSLGVRRRLRWRNSPWPINVRVCCSRNPQSCRRRRPLRTAVLWCALHRARRARRRARDEHLGGEEGSRRDEGGRV